MLRLFLISKKKLKGRDQTVLKIIKNITGFCNENLKYFPFNKINTY